MITRFNCIYSGFCKIQDFVKYQPRVSSFVDAPKCNALIYWTFYGSKRSFKRLIFQNFDWLSTWFLTFKDESILDPILIADLENWAEIQCFSQTEMDSSEQTLLLTRDLAEYILLEP